MQAEKFYKHIQEKIEQPNTEPTWNKADVWQRIEQRNVRKKSPFVFWQAAAASIVLLGVFGVYFFSKNNMQVTDNQIIKLTDTQKFIPVGTNKATKFTPKILAKNQIVLQSLDDNKSLVEIPENVIAKTIIEPQIIEKTIPEKQELALDEAKELTKSDDVFTEKPSVEKASFVANQAILDVRIPKKRERVAILEIPDDENNNIPQKEKRKNYAARLAKKIDKKSKTESEELPSLETKPSKIWAFVKQSFRNETMVVDSTEK